MESLTLQLEQQRARLLRSHSLESQKPSVYAAPYNNNDNNNNIMDSPGSSSQYCESSTCPYDPSSPYPALYYVESPSTIVNLSSVDFHHDTDDDRNPNPSSLGYSLNDHPPLSRSASFLSRSWVSEPVSLMDVTARLQSWCKLQPSSSQAKLISSSCKWDTVVLDEEMTGVEGWFDWGIKRSSSRCRDRLKSLAVFMCMMVLLTTLLLGISTSVYWLFCHPKAPITTLKVMNSTLLLIWHLNHHSFFIIISFRSWIREISDWNFSWMATDLPFRILISTDFND